MFDAVEQRKLMHTLIKLLKCDFVCELNLITHYAFRDEETMTRISTN